MKIIYTFFALFIFISSSVHAQSYKDSLPSKSVEQKEMKATNHLKKELELKQLSAQPERITDTMAFFKNTDKKKHKNCKPGTLKERNKHSK